MSLRLLTTGLFCATLALGTSSAFADVWSFTDQDDVVHFTNVRPTGASAGKWKLVQKDDPANGKAAARRG